MKVFSVFPFSKVPIQSQGSVTFLQLEGHPRPFLLLLKSILHTESPRNGTFLSLCFFHGIAVHGHGFNKENNPEFSAGYAFPLSSRVAFQLSLRHFFVKVHCVSSVKGDISTSEPTMLLINQLPLL
jgi:hypothetical protein